MSRSVSIRSVRERFLLNAALIGHSVKIQSILSGEKRSKRQPNRDYKKDKNLNEKVSGKYLSGGKIERIISYIPI